MGTKQRNKKETKEHLWKLGRFSLTRLDQCLKCKKIVTDQLGLIVNLIKIYLDRNCSGLAVFSQWQALSFMSAPFK